MKAENAVFFDANGITSTSANNIANRAKEIIAEEQEFLSNIQLTNKYVALAIKGEYVTISTGLTDADIEEIDTSIDKLSAMHRMISWFREAINAKDDEIKNAGKMSFEDWCEAFNKEVPTYPTRQEYPDPIAYPEEPHVLTEAEAIAQLSIKERARYYALEAQNGAYGKLVGKNGSLTLERKRMLNKKHNPASTNGTGQDLEINKEVPSVTISLLDEKFNKLVTVFNAGNSELNGIKKKVQDAIDASKNASIAEYKRLLAEYEKADAERDNMIDKIDNEHDAACRRYQNAKAILKNEYAEWQTTEQQSAQALKIVIPNNYKEIVDYIRSLGK